jgi:hypothetical protein
LHVRLLVVVETAKIARQRLLISMLSVMMAWMDHHHADIVLMGVFADRVE